MVRVRIRVRVLRVSVRVRTPMSPGEVLSIKPLRRHQTAPTEEVEIQTEVTRKESLPAQLTLNSFTRHGYNVEHMKGPVCGPLPGSWLCCYGNKFALIHSP